MQYPSNSNIVNVTAYGAVGDGVTINTTAIQNAINAVTGSHKFLYFPTGTYLIDGELTGNLHGRLYLIGQSKTGSIIKLKDGCAGYSSSTSPKSMIRFDSDNPTDSIGSGNQAFGNSLVDLTIKAGANNPGAVAVKYLANNFGKIQNVVLDGVSSGAVGLSLERYGQGPALISNLTINGFDVEIDSHVYDYSLFFEHIFLNNPRVQGITCYDGNPLFFRDLNFTSDSGKSLGSFQDNSEITVLSGSITNTGPSANYAIQVNSIGGGNGQLLLRDVAVSGYNNAINLRGTAIPVSSVGVGKEYSSIAFRELVPSIKKTLGLPIKETPSYAAESFYSDFSQWQAVGANTGGSDDSVIAAALNSGKPVIYFPYRQYKITGSQNVPASVRWIVGMNSNIQIDVANANNYFNDANNPKPIWIVSAGTNSLIIENFVAPIFTHDPGLAGADCMHNNSARSYVCLKSSDYGRGEYRNDIGSSANALGEFYIEDVAVGAQFGRAQTATLRQFNNEMVGKEVKTLNNGGKILFLGYKTEQPGIMVKTINNGYTELYGAVFNNVPPPADLPVVEDVDSTATYIVSSGLNYRNVAVWKQTKNGSTQIANFNSLPQHGNGFLLHGSSISDCPVG